MGGVRVGAVRGRATATRAAGSRGAQAGWKLEENVRWRKVNGALNFRRESVQGQGRSAGRVEHRPVGGRAAVPGLTCASAGCGDRRQMATGTIEMGFARQRWGVSPV